jgi:RNA polymerase sigma-70 factor (ECF subfamily)
MDDGSGRDTSANMAAIPPSRGMLDPPAGEPSGSNVSASAQTTDEALVGALAKRDARALAELVRRHGGWAARFATRLTGSPETAEEVVQNAFLRLWNGAQDWQGRARFTTWFYRVVHNLAIDELRRRRRTHDALDDTLQDPAPTPVERLESERRSARVQAALSALPQRQRTALVLSHYEGLPQAEAAAIMGISEGALESLLSRGRAALRERLRSELH